MNDAKANICIIEDEAIIAFDIMAILEDLGYSISKILHHSDKAIDYLSFNSPDLVLCDINIKGPKDGIEVATAIRKKKAIPFVFLTSLSDRDTIQRARHALPYGYIVKPFVHGDLLSSIEIALFKYQEELDQLKISKTRLETLWGISLTDKEYEIITHMIEGNSYQDMEQKMKVSINTIKYHTKNIYAKCDVANKAELLQTLLVHFVNL